MAGELVALEARTKRLAAAELAIAKLVVAYRVARQVPRDCQSGIDTLEAMDAIVSKIINQEAVSHELANADAETIGSLWFQGHRELVLREAIDRILNEWD